MRKLLTFFVVYAWMLLSAHAITGIVTRLVVLSPTGQALDVEITGWLVEYDTTNYTGQMISLNVGSNGIVTSGRVVCNEADIEAASPYRGLILCNTNSEKYVVGIDDAGALYTMLISASPEIPFTNRVDKINEKLDQRSIGRRGTKSYKEGDIIVDKADWGELHTNLNVKVKAGEGDKIFVNCTIYGKADATKTLRASYFLNDDNQGGNAYGLAYTDAQTVSCIGFTDMTKALTNGVYWIKPMIRGKGTVVSGNVRASMTFMVIEESQ